MSQKILRPSQQQLARCAQNKTQHSNDGLRGTESAIEDRIRELRALMDAALAAGNKTAFKALFDQWNEARAARSLELLHKLDERHLADFEIAETLGRYGFYAVPSHWVATGKRAGPVAQVRNAARGDSRDWDEGGQNDSQEGAA